MVSSIFQGCKDFVQRWSYAIPLEIVFSTPLTNWNPYNIRIFDEGEEDLAKAGGATGKSAGSALKGASLNQYYITPAEFFSSTEENSENDKADSVKNFVCEY